MSGSSVVTRTIESHRREILTEAVLVIASYVVVVWLTAGVLQTRDTALRYAFAILIVLGLSLLTLAICLVIRKIAAERRSGMERRLRPDVIATLVDISRGEDRSTHLVALADHQERAIEPPIIESLVSQKGAGLGRIAKAIEQSGIPRRWRRMTESSNPDHRYSAIIGLGLLEGKQSEDIFQRALEDPEEIVALESARALIRTRDHKVIENLFLDLPRQSRLVRALVSEWLRPYCSVLAMTTVPEMLRSSDRHVVLTTLEILDSWRRALPLPDVAPLLGNADPEIRAGAWRVVPYLQGVELPNEQVHDGVADADATVRCAAINAIGRAGLQTAGAEVRTSIFDPDLRVSQEAAYALAASGERAELERIASSGVVPACYCATEALEKLNIGRLAR